MNEILRFFNSDDFMPHGHCFLWQKDILYLQVLSDACIAIAYYLILLLMFYLIRKRTDLPFKTLFGVFAAFILLCGTTHVLAIWVLWNPDYAAEGVVKALTAIVSLAALFVLWVIVPKILQMINPEIIKRHAAEKRLYAIVDNALDGLISIDTGGVIEHFNPACERIFGYSTKEVIGRNIKVLMPEPYHSEHDGYLSRYLKTGEARIIGTAGREVTGRRKDGSVFPMDLSISTYLLEDGRHFSGTIRDISERKEAEGKILQYTKDLEGKNRELQVLARSNIQLDEFAYIASHDLKAPLRVIDNTSKWLEEDLQEHLSGENRENMNLLRGRVHRMETLLDDLLEYSRIGRTEDDRYREALPGDALMRDIVGLLSPPEGFKVVVSAAFANIRVRRMPLQQILMNLIGNAIKHHDKRQGVIEVTVQDAEPDYVFVVRDDGPGIPAQFHEQIFKMFQTLKPRDQVEGSGMGLAMVRQNIEIFGGKIQLDSAEGKGSAFRFTWPKQQRLVSATVRDPDERR